MIRLFEWYISEQTHHDKLYYFAWGRCLGHHKLPDGMDIHTSYIKTLSFDKEENRFIAVTRSESNYELYLTDMKRSEESETKRCLQCLNNTLPAADELDRSKKIAEEKELAEVSQYLNENELYMDFLGFIAVKGYYMNGSGNIMPAFPSVHVGTFQDSYLVQTQEKGADFRYFIDTRGIKPYCWSEQIHTIKIHNLCKDDFDFKDYEGKIIECKGGKITAIKRIEESSHSEETHDMI